MKLVRIEEKNVEKIMNAFTYTPIKVFKSYSEINAFLDLCNKIDEGVIEILTKKRGDFR